LPSDDSTGTSDGTSDQISDRELRRRLPPPPRPRGGYVPAVAHELVPGRGGLVLTAGITPRVDGVLRHRGRLGRDLGVDEGRAAARLAADNALAAALGALGGDRQLDRVLRLTVYVNAADGFEEHTAVADGASARLRELCGARGDAARAAVGVASLPGGACVELELTCSWTAPGA
jgi:enamine deaminase RidA (YjgF/YER057c/UK114 family)